MPHPTVQKFPTDHIQRRRLEHLIRTAGSHNPMKRFFIIFAILGAAVSGAARSAALAEQTLPAFDRLAVEGFTDVTLVQGGAETIAVEGGSTEYLRSLKLDVTDGRLTIETTRMRRWWSNLVDDGTPPRITITFRKLAGLSVEGAATVRADRVATDQLTVVASGATSVSIKELEATELAVTGSGALKMDVGGRTVTQTIRMSGAADYRAARLDSETATVTVSGAGRAVVRAQKALDIGVSGAGSVEYYGDPKVTQEIRGEGSISRKGSAD